MSYLLFYAPGTASLAVHWMLIELGVPFEAELVDIKAERSEAYLRLNPAGRVPTLVVDGTPVSESAALLMLLAERHPEGGFAPALVLLVAGTFIAVNFLVDLAFAWIDPRIRYR